MKEHVGVVEQVDTQDLKSCGASHAGSILALDTKTVEMTEIHGGMRVKWRSNLDTTDGSVLCILLDKKRPKRFGIEVEVRWDDGRIMRYGATDFGDGGNIEVIP